MSNRTRYEHRGWTVELTSYEVQQGPKNGPDHIKPTKEEADGTAGQFAVQWIRENG